MYGYIYESFNTFTNEFYIGQKKSDIFIESYLGSGKKQKESISKYGKDMFAVSLLQSANSQSELDLMEQYYIAKYKDEFGTLCINQAQGGRNCGNIYQYADDKTKSEFIQKMTNINRERCSSATFKEKCRENMHNRYADQLEREKQSTRLKETYELHPEFKEKRSNALKEYYSNNQISENIIFANQKKCYLDLNNNRLNFDSIHDMKKYLKEEYDFVLNDKTLYKLMNTDVEYKSFKKAEKFQKLNGMKISAQNRNSKLDKV